MPVVKLINKNILIDYAMIAFYYLLFTIHPTANPTISSTIARTIVNVQSICLIVVVVVIIVSSVAGWHAVLGEDLSYRNGVAIVDAEGNMLVLSNYVLMPRGVVEEYGDRPLVIFGNGLVRYRELVVWVGGVSDYAVGIFATSLDKLLETLRWIQRV